MHFKSCIKPLIENRPKINDRFNFLIRYLAVLSILIGAPLAFGISVKEIASFKLNSVDFPFEDIVISNNGSELSFYTYKKYWVESLEKICVKQMAQELSAD